MQDSKGRDSAETRDKLGGRKSEATSDETVSEIEESEKNTGTSDNRDPGPSPDGQVGDRDEVKNAEPM